MTTSNLVGAVRRVKQSILFALCKLNEIQFDAPWERRRGNCSGL